jgi:transcriptional regulator of nitric oxide reductase
MRPATARVAPAVLSVFTLFVILLGAPQAKAEALKDRLTPDVMAIVWPHAEKLGPEEGKPPAIAVYKDGKIAGYIFSTLDIVHAPGFSSIPFDVIAGTDLTGHISGAKVVFQREPHVYEDAIRQPQLDIFLARTAGLASQGVNPGALRPDYVDGASESARLMRDAVFESA